MPKKNIPIEKGQEPFLGSVVKPDYLGVKEEESEA